MPGSTLAMYSYERPWNPYRLIPVAERSRGNAYSCDTGGCVRWNAVSKHATCATSGAIRLMTRIGARLCGW